MEELPSSLPSVMVRDNSRDRCQEWGVEGFLPIKFLMWGPSVVVGRDRGLAFRRGKHGSGHENRVGISLTRRESLEPSE